MFNLPPEIKTVVVVEWLDASHQNGPISLEDLSGDHVIKSVGWLIQETAKRITLCQDLTSTEQFREVLHIPKLYILNRRDLKWQAFR